MIKEWHGDYEVRAVGNTVTIPPPKYIMGDDGHSYPNPNIKHYGQFSTFEDKI